MKLVRTGTKGDGRRPNQSFTNIGGVILPIPGLVTHTHTHTHTCVVVGVDPNNNNNNDDDDDGRRKLKTTHTCRLSSPVKTYSTKALTPCPCSLVPFVVSFPYVTISTASPCLQQLQIHYVEYLQYHL